MKKLLFLLTFIFIAEYSYSQCNGCGTRIVQSAGGVSRITDNGNGTITHNDGNGLEVTFSVGGDITNLDFTMLTAQQVIDLTQQIDFTQLTPAQITALCATITANCDIAVAMQINGNVLELLDGQGDALSSILLTDLAPDEVVFGVTAADVGTAAPANAQVGVNQTNGVSFYVDAGGNWASFPNGEAIQDEDSDTSISLGENTSTNSTDEIIFTVDGTQVGNVEILSGGDC